MIKLRPKGFTAIFLIEILVSCVILALYTLLYRAACWLLVCVQ